MPSSQQHIFFGVTPHVWLTGMREGREEGGRRNDTRLFSRSSPIFRLSNLSHSFGYQSKETRAIIEANKCLMYEEVDGCSGFEKILSYVSY